LRADGELYVDFEFLFMEGGPYSGRLFT